MIKNNSNKYPVELEKIRKFKNLLIKDAVIYNPFNRKKYVSDILIEKGYIKSAGSAVNLPGLEKMNDLFQNPYLGASGDLLVINAAKNVLCPAFIDMHVHLREPGDEDEETAESGINAALYGGITAVACMPNTIPPVDSEFLVKYLISRAEMLDFKLFPVAAMTRGLEGNEIADMGLLGEAGAVAFSDDGKCVQDSKLMYEIMKYAKQLDKLLILHEEDYSFSAGGLAHEGYYSAKLGLDGISSLSEEIMISRDLMFAKKTGARIHITHISSKGSVELIKKAKVEGLNISCDVTPHHLYFDDSFLDGYNPNFKINPPIRSAEDRAALIEGIKTGVIDVVASDHAPHLEIEKNTTFAKAANGAIGMETLFKAIYTSLCVRERFDLMDLISLVTVTPYKILGIRPAVFDVGQKADMVIINLDTESVVKKDDIRSKSSNSPFIGQRLASEIICTINNGNIAFFNFSSGKS